jgi:hypothetical protein
VDERLHPLRTRWLPQFSRDALQMEPPAKGTARRLQDYAPPTDWTLSSEAKRYIENSVIATTPAATRKRMSRRSKRLSKSFGDEASRTKRSLQTSDLQMRRIGVTLDHGFVIRASSGSKLR